MFFLSRKMPPAKTYTSRTAGFRQKVTHNSLLHLCRDKEIAFGSHLGLRQTNEESNLYNEIWKKLVIHD